MALKSYFPGSRKEAYLHKGAQQVEGWLHTYDRFVIASLGEFQTDQDISGGVCEIGIHHGTLFVLLYLGLHEGERGVAIDLFENQEQNIDRSGKGASDVFLAHIDRFAGSRDPLTIIAKNSLETKPEEITGPAGKIRIFSVDGGHTDAITRSDIELAEACLHDWGIIILDDVFNRNWPGVNEGLADFFSHNESTLVPFAIGINKVFLCRADKAAAYRAAMESRCAYAVQGEQRFHGGKVVLLGGETTLPALLGLTRLNGLARFLNRVRRKWLRFLDRLAYRVLR